jgi:hypothetical protein
MKLKKITSNCIELSIDDNKILFSYNVPVAIINKECKAFRTQAYWSITTTKHINKWLAGKEAKEMPQAYFNQFLIERNK